MTGGVFVDDKSVAEAGAVRAVSPGIGGGIAGEHAPTDSRPSARSCVSIRKLVREVL